MDYKYSAIWWKDLPWEGREWLSDGLTLLTASNLFFKNFCLVQFINLMLSGSCHSKTQQMLIWVINIYVTEALAMSNQAVESPVVPYLIWEHYLNSFCTYSVFSCLFSLLLLINRNTGYFSTESHRVAERWMWKHTESKKQAYKFLHVAHIYSLWDAWLMTPRRVTFSMS